MQSLEILGILIWPVYCYCYTKNNKSCEITSCKITCNWNPQFHCTFFHSSFLINWRKTTIFPVCKAFLCETWRSNLLIGVKLEFIFPHREKKLYLEAKTPSNRLLKIVQIRFPKMFSASEMAGTSLHERFRHSLWLSIKLHLILG